MLIDSVLTVDDRKFCWPFLPTLNLMTIHINTVRIITAIARPPITDARSIGTLVGIFEALVTVVVTIAVTIDVVSAGFLSLVVILHSFMKS